MRRLEQASFDRRQAGATVAGHGELDEKMDSMMALLQSMARAISEVKADMVIVSSEVKEDLAETNRRLIDLQVATERGFSEISQEMSKLREETTQNMSDLRDEATQEIYKLRVETIWGIRSFLVLWKGANQKVWKSLEEFEMDLSKLRATAENGLSEINGKVDALRKEVTATNKELTNFQMATGRKLLESNGKVDALRKEVTATRRRLTDFMTATERRFSEASDEISALRWKTSRKTCDLQTAVSEGFFKTNWDITDAWMSMILLTMWMIMIAIVVVRSAA